MAGRGNKWYRPPCHCESMSDEQKRIEQKAWKRFGDILHMKESWDETVNRIIEQIADSKYIDNTWQACRDCRMRAKRKAFALAIFLCKLKVVRSNFKF